ncbi:hypothetical protein [Martelella sp. FOR1707]
MKHIDGGGNADVWIVRDPESRAVAAIKILHDLWKEPLSRFRNEITALRELGNLEGIILILDSEFPEGKGSRPWYAMPVAETSVVFPETPMQSRSSPNLCV